MPQYKWWGIDLEGKDRQGSVIAVSVVELDKKLLQQEIALLRSKMQGISVRSGTWLERKMYWFEQLANLLRAGIYIDQALELAMIQEEHKRVRFLWEDILDQVHHGLSLAQAMATYPDLFNALDCAVIIAGYESGSLSTALESLSSYYKDIISWRLEMRRVLAGPLLTLLFFGVIALLIFIVILPTFATFFIASNQPIPPFTAFILNVSLFLRQWGVWLAGAISMVVGGVWAIRTYVPTARQRVRALTAYVPFLTSFRKITSVHQFCRALALLLGGGISLKQALEILENKQDNEIFSLCVHQVQQAILAGHSLYEALKQQPTFFNAQLLAFVRIGQESDTLSTMLFQGAQLYHQKMIKRLTLISFYAQPLLLGLLGLLIALLIMAVYLPIISLSYTIA